MYSQISVELFMSLNVENTHTSFARVGPDSQTKLQIQVISQYLSRGKDSQLPISFIQLPECMLRRKEGKTPPH